MESGSVSLPSLTPTRIGSSTKQMSDGLVIARPRAAPGRSIGRHGMLAMMPFFGSFP
jgi:hypothetical protein